MCCCTFVSNVLGIDAAGKAVTPLVLYGDTRAAPQAAALRARLDEEYFHQRTGTRFHSSYLPARFLWWQQEKPEEFARVRRWISIGEYLLLQPVWRQQPSATRSPPGPGCCDRGQPGLG